MASRTISGLYDDLMSKSTIGWLFVAVQVAVLLAIVVLPGSDDWATPTWLVLLSWLVTLTGGALVLISASKLGRSPQQPRR